MSKNKVRVPNIVRGGIAIPLGRNYYYMRGRKHETGGIDIGENPRTGLEVEDGEVMHMGDKETTVYSAQKFLGGLSPAERVMRGENPERVFRAQEDFKRRNNINDDGTKKKRNGGLSRSKDYGSSKKPYPKVKNKDFAGGHRSYPIPTKADARDALRLAGLHGRSDVKAKVYRKYPELRKKARNGGVFTLEANGKSKLMMIPSTGELTLSDTISPRHIIARYGTRRKAPAGTRTRMEELIQEAAANDRRRLIEQQWLNYANNFATNNEMFTRREMAEAAANGYITMPAVPRALQQYLSMYNVQNVSPNDIGYDEDGYLFTYDDVSPALRQAITHYNQAKYNAEEGLPEPNYTRIGDYYAEVPVPMEANALGTIQRGLRIARVAGRRFGRNASRRAGSIRTNIANGVKNFVRPAHTRPTRNNTNGTIINNNSDANFDDMLRAAVESSRTQPINTARTARTRSLSHRIDDFANDHPYITGGVILPTVGFPLAYGTLYGTGKLVEATNNTDNNIDNNTDNSIVSQQSTIDTSRVQTTAPINTTKRDIINPDTPLIVNSTPMEAIKRDTTIKTDIPRDTTIIRTNQGDTLRYVQNNPLAITMPTSTNKSISTPVASNSVASTTNSTQRRTTATRRNTTNNTSTEPPSFSVPKRDEIMRIISKEHKSILNVPLNVSDTISRANSSITPNTTINLPSSSTIIATRRTNNETNRTNRANNVGDWIGLGSNITSGLIGNIINRNMLNDLEYSSAPIPRIAPKLKTRININPQLDNMRESLAAYERNVVNNTGSSQVALSRQQRARLANMIGTNSIYGNKENTETQLINADRLNQQEVANQNIKDYNTWAQNKAAFDNTIREQQAENNIGLIDTINSGIQNMISNRQQRRAYNQTNAAMLFASPNLPVEMLYAQGLITKETRDAYRKAYPLNN